MVTVKQLEKRLKVSRVSIYSQIKKPEFKGHTFKDAGGVTQIDNFSSTVVYQTVLTVVCEVGG